MVMGVCLRQFCLDEDICLYLAGTGYDGLLWGVMYSEWFGICDFVVLSVVEVCVDYGGGVCVNVCGVVCIVVCCFV